VGVDVVKPLRKVGERFDVVLNQRPCSQLTELGRAQKMQQKQRLYTHAHVSQLSGICFRHTVTLFYIGQPAHYMYFKK